MKNMNMKRYGLQLFADGDGNGAEGAGDGASEGNEDGDNANEDKPMSFDDFLKQEGNQAEFDRRVQKATQTVINNAKQKWQALTDDKLSETEKLAKMSKEEKALYKAQQLEKELADLKRKNALSEMTSTARKMLAEDSIVVADELLNNIVYEDAEKTKESVEAFKRMYKAAVQDGIKKQLTGRAPSKGSSNSITKEQILEVKDPAERQRLIAENMSLFRR